MYNDEFKIQYKSIPFAIYAGNYIGSEISKDIERLPHQHKETELLVVLNGKAELHLEEDDYSIEKGDVVIISPYAMHRTTIFKGTDFKHICICFDLELIYDKELKKQLENGEVGFYPPVIKAGKTAAELAKYAERAYEAGREKKTAWEFETVAQLSLFFGATVRGGLIAEALPQNSFCHDVYTYIEENFREGITSRSAAESLFMSNSYFCRKFKRYFGRCFTDYLCMRRIEKSKHLLRHSSLPISEVANMSGFQSFSYYGKVFRELCGITPSEYRKKKNK